MKTLPLALASLSVAGFLAQAADAEPDTSWQTSAGVNVAVNKGNSDTLLMGANILTLKKWDKNEFSAGADGVYGNNKDVNTGVRSTTAQSYGAFFQYNRLFNDRWYGLGRGELRQDRIADLKYRAPLSVGVGYYAIKNERTTLAFEVGPGVVFEQFRRQAGTQYITFRAGEKFTHKFNERVRLVQELDFTPQVDDLANYVVVFSATLEADLTKKLSTRLTVQDNYRNEPAPGRKENDLRILAGLGYKF